MKITIVTGPFLPLPPLSCGAVEKLWADLGERFAAEGHEVTFVSKLGGDQSAHEQTGFIQHIRCRGYRRTNRLWKDLIFDALYSLRIFFALPKADILVTNATWLPLLAARRPSRGKIVVNVQRAPKKQMFLYKSAARLAATSEAVRSQIFAQTPSVARLVKVLPNPIDVHTFVPPPNGRDWAANPKILLYTGRIHPEKGVHVLIDAFARLRPANGPLILRIIGPSKASAGGGGEKYLTELKTRAEALPVEFLPPITDRHALAAALQAAHFYCYPSLADQGESFGVAPLEAMATGLVPVVSDLACFLDFAQPGVNALVFDHRHDAVANLAAKLEELIGNPDQITQMGQRAVDTAQRFSNETVANLYLSDFNELLRFCNHGAS